MSEIDSRLQEIYTGICRVLRYPHEYGLGESVPQALVDRLEIWLSLLNEILQQEAKVPYSPNGELETELSQDADSPCHVEGR